MYCINCGVELADSEKKCPLCGVHVFHPELPRPDGEPLYPRYRYPATQVEPRTALIILSAMFALAALITLLCDIQVNQAVTWSGFVSGALGIGYVAVLLPFWFRRPNPVIFVPIDFAAVGLYVLYINCATGGHWFLSFAFPVIGFFGLVTTAMVTLTRYVRRGRLYIFGGAGIALGLFMPLMEFLIMITFDLPRFAFWSVFPMLPLVLLGGLLIYLAISRSAREAMERKFFI